MDLFGSSKDPHSFANPELARIRNMDLELSVNFLQEVLEGKATLLIECKKPAINEIILDNLGLVISSVTNAVDGTRLDYQIEDSQVIGSRFCVQLPPTTIDITNKFYGCKIQIEYKTDPNSRALHWLKPEQTADGKHPFLLSNNKLIYARAWFPCQDTPSVKFTYSAKISVSKYYQVVMSACLLSARTGYPDIMVYKYFQNIPVPSYAVIIAVGSLRSVVLNGTVVYAERKFIDKCVDTFCSDTIRTMLQIARELCGPYLWVVHYICVLPPSIAHFEIECPCVTFISPTLLGGDRSRISKLAGNISQSWAGHLVTCSNYEHLWLNRSFSAFIGIKIYCKMLNHEDMKSFLERIELRDLNNKIQNPANIGLLKCLLPNVMDELPNKATKYVPYERGCMFLVHLESILGGPLKFEPFLKSYFSRFARKSINTKDFKSYLFQYFSFHKTKEILDNVPWNEWFHNVPSPLVVPKWTTWEINLLKLAVGWIKWDYKLENMPSLLIDGENLCDLQIMIFLHYLHYFYKCLNIEKLISILHRHALYSKNYEIRYLWLLLCVKVRWTEKAESALKFAIKFCSPNYACPIFQHMYEWDEEMRGKAIDTYKKNKGRMLYETQQKLDIILHLSS